MSEQHAIQLSIKHGPNASLMTNIRGNTAAEVVGAAADFAAVYSDIDEAIKTVQAVDAVAQSFPEAQPVNSTSTAGGGTACAHGVARKRIAGTSKKTGKPYVMWVCDVEGDPSRPKCEAVFEK